MHTAWRCALPRLDQHEADILAEQWPAADRRPGPLRGKFVSVLLAFGQANDRLLDKAVILGAVAK